MSVCLSVCLPFPLRIAVLLALALPLLPVPAPHLVNTQLPERGWAMICIALELFPFAMLYLPAAGKVEERGGKAPAHMHNFMLTTATWFSFSLP